MINRAMAFYAAIGKSQSACAENSRGTLQIVSKRRFGEVFHLVDMELRPSRLEVAIAHGPACVGRARSICSIYLFGRRRRHRSSPAHLGGPIESWWNDLGSPRMSPALMARVAEQTIHYGASTMPELSAGVWDRSRSSQGQVKYGRPLLTNRNPGGKPNEFEQSYHHHCAYWWNGQQEAEPESADTT
jgi:hypothetical protein